MKDGDHGEAGRRGIEGSSEVILFEAEERWGAEVPLRKREISLSALTILRLTQIGHWWSLSAAFLTSPSSGRFYSIPSWGFFRWIPYLGDTAIFCLGYCLQVFNHGSGNSSWMLVSICFNWQNFLATWTPPQAKRRMEEERMAQLEKYREDYEVKAWIIMIYNDKNGGFP